MSGDRDLFENEEEARAARARVDAGDPFADAGEIAERRGRGRPKGALNVKTRDFERYYGAMGYRDPLVAWAQFLTRSPLDLQMWIEEHERAQVAVGKEIRDALPTLFEIVQEQHRCAERLAPYLHGKKPVQVEIIDERLPTLIVDLGTNQIAEARKVAQRQALTVGSPIEGETELAWQGAINKNNDLADGEE